VRGVRGRGAPTVNYVSNVDMREGGEMYRDEANASRVTEPVHLAFFLAIQEVVVVLHAHKLAIS
jgi:hypothetical protein